MADQDHGPRLPQRFPIRARNSTPSTARRQLASASGSAPAAPPSSTSLFATFNPYSFVAGKSIPRSAQLHSRSANPRVHGGAALETLVPSKPAEGRVRASQARGSNVPVERGTQSPASTGQGIQMTQAEVLAAGGGSVPIERGTQSPASTNRGIEATQAEALTARPFSTTPTIDVARLLLRLEDREIRTPAPSDAVSRYWVDFPDGFGLIPTSGEGRLCGLNAVVHTMTAMYPSLPRPTATDLHDVFNLPEYAEIAAACGLTNTDNFHVDQIGAALYFWGTTYHGLNLQLGYLPVGQVPQLVPHPNEDPTIVIWITNDNLQFLEGESLEGETPIPLFNHFSGVKALTDECLDGSQDNEQIDQSDVRATSPIVLSESPMLVENSEASDVFVRPASSHSTQPQGVGRRRPKRRERAAERDQASRMQQTRNGRPEAGSQTGEGAGVVTINPAARQTRGETDAVSSRGTDSGTSKGAAILVEEHPYTHAVLYEIRKVERLINKYQGESSCNEGRFPDQRLEKHKAILRLLRRRQQTLASDIKEMERMPSGKEYNSTVRRILSQSKDPKSRYNLFQKEIERLVTHESTPENKSMIAELIRVIKKVRNIDEHVPKSPVRGLVRSSALEAAADDRLEDDRNRARTKRARQERASRAR